MKRNGALFPTLASLTLGGAVHAPGSTAWDSSSAASQAGARARSSREWGGAPIPIHDYRGRPVQTRLDRRTDRIAARTVRYRNRSASGSASPEVRAGA